MLELKVKVIPSQRYQIKPNEYLDGLYDLTVREICYHDGSMRTTYVGGIWREDLGWMMEW